MPLGGLGPAPGGCGRRPGNGSAGCYPCRVDADRTAPWSLDAYHVTHRTGVTSAGEVWAGTDTLRGERVRLVRVRALPDDPRAYQALSRAATELARLDVAAVAAPREVLASDEGVVVVTDPLPGRTLGELAAGGPLGEYPVLQIGGALAATLPQLHRRGVRLGRLGVFDVLVRDAGPATFLEPGLAVAALDPAGAGRAGGAPGGDRPESDVGLLAGVLRSVLPAGARSPLVSLLEAACGPEPPAPVVFAGHLRSLAAGAAVPGLPPSRPVPAPRRGTPGRVAGGGTPRRAAGPGTARGGRRAGRESDPRPGRHPGRVRCRLPRPALLLGVPIAAVLVLLLTAPWGTDRPGAAPGLPTRAAGPAVGAAAQRSGRGPPAASRRPAREERLPKRWRSPRHGRGPIARPSPTASPPGGWRVTLATLDAARGAAFTEASLPALAAADAPGSSQLAADQAAVRGLHRLDAHADHYRLRLVSVRLVASRPGVVLLAVVDELSGYWLVTPQGRVLDSARPRPPTGFRVRLRWVSGRGWRIARVAADQG
jgi:hypothetical protein